MFECLKIKSVFSVVLMVLKICWRLVYVRIYCQSTAFTNPP